MSDSLATWIIAAAAVANVFVYVKLWQESKKQNAATGESLRLARDAFLESHKPALAVSVINCQYFGDTAQVFDGEIVVENSGTSSAREVGLQIRFYGGGFDAVKDIGPITIQPHVPFKVSFSFPMTSEMHRVGQLKGNRLGIRADGSYRGIDSRSYTYSELQEYDPALTRFVAIHTG